MVAVKAQLYSPPQQTSIIQFLYDASRRPSTFSKLAGSFMSAISASFGLGETAESAAAADRKQGELAESAPPALFPSGPNSVVSVTATHTAVLSYLPPSAEGASAQTVAVGAVLQPPHAAITRSDSDFARELDCQLNGLPPNP